MPCVPNPQHDNHAAGNGYPSLRKANPPPTALPSCGVQVNFKPRANFCHVERIDINNLNPICRHSQGIPKALRAQDQVSPALPFPIFQSTKLKENRKRQRKQIKRVQHV